MAEQDTGYKLIFSHPRMVEDLLRGFIREPWVEQLDFSTLERVSGSFATDDLRDRHNDVMWRLSWRPGAKGPIPVYLLLELQAAPDPFMAVRLLSYLALLYEDLIRHKRLTPARRLPPVLMVVLYNGS